MRRLVLLALVVALIVAAVFVARRGERPSDAATSPERADVVRPPRTRADAPPPPPVATRVVRGTVKDADGKPVDGADVVVLPVDSSGRKIAGQPVADFARPL